MPEIVASMPKKKKAGAVGSKYDMLKDGQPRLYRTEEFESKERMATARIYLYQLAEKRGYKASCLIRDEGLYVQWTKP